MLKTLSTGQVLLRDEDDLREWFRQRRWRIDASFVELPESYPCFGDTNEDWAGSWPHYVYVSEILEALKETGR